MTPESIPQHWLAALERAESLDPIIREALRPVYDRLRADAPDQAATFSMAMICRALRMIEIPESFAVPRDEIRSFLAEVCAAYVAANPDHPGDRGVDDGR